MVYILVVQNEWLDVGTRFLPSPDALGSCPWFVLGDPPTTTTQALAK